MRCYRCNNEIKKTDNYCNQCGSKVINYKSKEKEIIRFRRKSNGSDFFGFALSCLITKVVSIFLIFIIPLNIFIPWLLISLIFALIGLIKYKDKRNIILVIVDIILIIIEIFIIFLLILVFKNILNSLIRF